MTRQYIGARYVPKFYEGSDGNNWDANVIYEPLTVVTYLTNSYTSKKLVPSTIGNPIENPDYWAPTGVYNAQVEEYRRIAESFINNKNEAIAIYVAEDGNDVNDGLSIYHPVKTLKRAFEIARMKYNYAIHEIWVKPGHYAGLKYDNAKGVNVVMRGSGDIYIDSDFAMRNGCTVLFGGYTVDGRDEATWHFGGADCINAIYCYGGSTILMNCPCVIDNCQNGIVVDDGGIFAAHERDTVVTFGSNIRGFAVESTKSLCGLGIVNGGVVPIGYQVHGGFLTVHEDNLRAIQRYNVLDGGYVGMFNIDTPNDTKDYYVDAVNGDDHNPGTSALPVKTINKAIELSRYITKGYKTFITVLPGTYNGFEVANEHMVITFNGNSVINSVILVRHGAILELLGGHELNIHAPNDNAVFVAENSELKIGSVLTFENAKNGIYCGTGSKVVSTSSEDIIAFYNISEYAIKCEQSDMRLGVLAGDPTNGIDNNGGLITYKSNLMNASATFEYTHNGGRIFGDDIGGVPEVIGTDANFLRWQRSGNTIIVSGLIHTNADTVTVRNLPITKYNTNIPFIALGDGNNGNLVLDAGSSSNSFNVTNGIDYLVNASYFVN